MLRKNISTNGPIEVRVGDVYFHIMRIGQSNLTLVVDAPREKSIEIVDEFKRSQASCESEPDCDTNSQ